MPRGSISAKYVIIISILFFTSVVANTDFQECFQQLQQGTWGSQGAVDFWGNPVTTLTQATGLTFSACQKNCGPGSEAFDWVLFSQKFSAWVLPYLALISQLPYGANDRLSNFEAIVMSVGSPMLAAYSLILTVISNRWMGRRLGKSRYLSSYFAVVVLGGLQQVSLSLAGDQHILPSLTLKENDEFWRILAHGLEYSTPRWNLPAIFSMVFVTISYIFTCIDTVRCNLNNEGSCSGQSFGSLWLSLIPIVYCNLQLSPKTDMERILNAFTKAQKQFHVITDRPDGFAQPSPQCKPLTVRTACIDPVDEDVVCPTPVCYYARVFQWFDVAREIRDTFEASSRTPLASEMDNQLPVTVEHCRPPRDADRQRDDRRSLLGMISSSIILAAVLQWGTIGAAIMSHYMTPTKGLSCRSGSNLLYASLATVVWLLSFISSVCAYTYSKAPRSPRIPFFTKFVRAVAINLRIAAKIIAGLNVVWVFMFTLFQFTKTYDTCFCNASVLGLGTNKAYVVMTYSASQMKTIRSYWTAGMFAAAGTALFFVIAFNILRQRPEMPLNALGQDQEGHAADGNPSYSPVDLFQRHFQ